MNGWNRDCKNIVMEYLLHYCYKDTAKALLDEIQRLDACSKGIKLHKHYQDNQELNDNKHTAGMSMLDKSSIEWSQIDARKDIYNAIKQGDIGRAFALMEKHFPNLIRTYNTINRMETSLNDKSTLPKSHYIIYKLRCQQFVETLRTLGDIEAMEFAKYHFRPCSKLYPELTNNATSLIAYTDVDNHDRSQQCYRDEIAEQVNEMLLESQHFSPQTTLEKLWRQKTAIQVELENQKRQESSQNQQEAEKTKTSSY